MWRESGVAEERAVTFLMRSLEIAAVVGVLTLGCSGVEEDPARLPQEGRGVASPVFGEHRFRQSLMKGVRAVGDDCSGGGQGECASGLCLHTGTEPGAGYVCSKVCEAPAECPPEWRCAQAHPGSAMRLCIPPAS